MNLNIQYNHGIFIGTMGGTVSGLCNIFQRNDFLHTALLSALGAAVSFIVSYLLNALFKKWKR